jgi:hypothetical protein
LALDLKYGHALFVIQADEFPEAEVLIGAMADGASPEPRAQRLAARSAGFLSFHAGRWDVAAEAFDASVLEDAAIATDRPTASAMQAVLRLRRSPLPVPAGVPQRRAGSDGGEPTSRWAQALFAEAAGNAAMAVAAAHDVMAAIRGEAPIRLRFFGPDLVRIALASGDSSLAEEVVALLEHVERRASVASVTGVWVLCAGMVERDVDRLVESVRLLALSPRRVLQAHA